MSIAEKLRDSIALWLEGKKNRNLSMLARISKVGYSTIRRIMQDETTTPLPEISLKLAAIVMSEAEMNSFAEENMPLLAKTRTAIAYRSSDDSLELINDKRYIPVILLASHRDGTNIEEVRCLFGHEMTYRFQDLVESGLLKRCSDENWMLDKDIGSVNLETAREWLGVFSNICPSANDLLPRSSAAHVGWETVNFETALAVYHATIDYMRTTAKLTSDKNNKGDILIFFGSIFNVLKGQEYYK